MRHSLTAGFLILHCTGSGDDPFWQASSAIFAELGIVKTGVQSSLFCSFMSRHCKHGQECYYR